ncbi:hypothetical protein ACIBJC_08420 [Streptomyces sp. NPDC050509]|uniref:hypothetical protein n=1 Tax=Streptomyces sp. NPDC050509 TaxID=3365620 RepID=UPI00378A2950
MVRVRHGETEHVGGWSPAGLLRICVDDGGEAPVLRVTWSDQSGNSASVAPRSTTQTTESDQCTTPRLTTSTTGPEQPRNHMLARKEPALQQRLHVHLVEMPHVHLSLGQTGHDLRHATSACPTPSTPRLGDRKHQADANPVSREPLEGKK